MTTPSMSLSIPALHSSPSSRFRPSPPVAIDRSLSSRSPSSLATGKPSRVFHPLRNVELDTHVDETVLPEPCNAPMPSSSTFGRRQIDGGSPQSPPRLRLHREEGYLSGLYFDSSMEDPLLQSTVEMLENRDRDACALRMELYATRARLWTALTQLAPVVQTGMVFTRLNRAPAHEQGKGSQVSQEELPHLPSLAEVMLEAERNKRETNRLLERIEKNTARRPRNAAVSLNDFVKLNPPKFHHSVDPLDADDWLCSISCKIRCANVSEADKVTFAAYFLEGPANLWWENLEAMHPAEPAATWADFSAAFRLHHIQMGPKREEFCAFTQGKLTVDAYSREFGNPTRYATEEVSTNAKKQARFR
ncbi:hypothetical protein ZWY2020_005931 [Hordeum vulgare]|nr:hypothetical protein ZWY2020_005931 [Hordeum vulgare]